MIRHATLLLSATSAAALAMQQTAAADIETLETENGPVAVELVVDGFDHPWAMAFLPDGRLLVTERNTGNVYIVTRDGERSAPLEDTPTPFIRGQGGMLDVALDPDFEENRYVYLSFAEAGDGGASTAIGRGRLEDDRIADFEVLYRQVPKVSGGNHFGGRIAFAPDGTLFLVLGERWTFDRAQDLANTLGKVVRIERDGTVPEDNPFAGQDEALPEIWSYGHRNILAAAFRPGTRELWVAEMGPKGGDELNQPQAGSNYGWAIVSWGEHYDGTPIPDPPTHPEFADAVHHWTPAISPSGMIFYTGEMFPAWKGNALIGGLTARGVVRLAFDGDEVAHEERLVLDTRIRDVEQGLDGSVYLLTDENDGRLLRLHDPS